MATIKRAASVSTPVSVKLDADERRRLASLATARKRSSHYLMREAVREYLTREEARQSFRDEAAKAWDDYVQSGRHTTQAELDAWVDSLSSRKRRRAPKWQR
jgi:predicted transcriptional regulator